MYNLCNSSTEGFGYFKPEVLSNFIFKEDITDEDDMIDIHDGRLEEIFMLDDPAEQELKSNIFFGRKFKKLALLYSSWRKYNLLFSIGSYIQSINCTTSPIKYADSSDEDKHVLDVNCVCTLASFDINKLDTKYLSDVIFPEVKTEPMQVNMYNGSAY